MSLHLNSGCVSQESKFLTLCFIHASQSSIASGCQACCVASPVSTSQILNPSNWADGAGIALHRIWPPLSNHFFKNLVVCRDEFYTRFHFIPLQVTFLGFLNLMKSDNSVCVFGWHFESRIVLLFLWIMSSQCIL